VINVSIWNRFFGPPSSAPPAGKRAKSPAKAGRVGMTPEELIAEGRQVQRDCVFLTPSGEGEAAATWHREATNIPPEPGFQPWLSIDTRFVPGLDSKDARFLTVFTSDEELTGRIDIVATLPAGRPLYARPANVLPPIEAVFALGSDRVGEWLLENDWARDTRYNPNFADAAIVERYDQQWFKEYPVYANDPDIYAMLGGWHFPNADDDWHDLVPQRLIALTLKDSEPWVEAWQAPGGELHAIQRIT
jgi:hypothetical protein